MSISSDLALLISLLLSRGDLLLFTSIHPTLALCLSLLYQFATFRTHKLCPLPSYIHSLSLVRSFQAVSGLLPQFIQMSASSHPRPTFLDPNPVQTAGHLPGIVEAPMPWLIPPPPLHPLHCLTSLEKAIHLVVFLYYQSSL